METFRSFGKWSLISLILMIGSVATAFAQQITVTGTVKDAGLREPLPGVTVQLKGSNSTLTITDYDGNYSLSVPGNGTLVYTFVGMRSQEIAVNGRSKIDITLAEDVEALDEVIVIGFGSVKRKDVTTSVSTVSTKDINERPIVSAAQAIQGRAAGVQVTQPSGEPGAGMVVRIRGNSSINASNDPLYVVDGVPMTDINFLSPNDIESMQILKDASSAAIYGSRASNGVVLITTKSGSKGEAKIQFSAYAGISNVIKEMQSLKMKDYYDLMGDLGYTLPQGLTDQTDWFKETYQTGVNQNYQMSFSNGNDKMRYFISGGYTRDNGVIKVSFYERYNFRMNLENQIRSWLKINTNVSYSDYSSNGIISGQGSNRGGVVLSVINTPTYAPIWDPNNEGQFNNNFYGANLTHPVENMDRSAENRSNSSRLLASASAEITLLPNLKFKSTTTFDRDANHQTSFLDPKRTTWGRHQYGEASDTRGLSTVMVYDNILSWDTSFGKHSVNTMGGMQGTTSHWSQSRINASHFLNGEIPTTNAGNRIDPYGTGSWASDWAIMSYVARASYNYDSKYLLTANFRADGSSKLAPKNRWGFFPSVSAAWRISSEGFMEDATRVDDLKFRAGWGQTGNQSGIGDYAYLMRYNINRQNWWEDGRENSLPILTPANMRNKDLTWETTSQANIGVDLSMFNGRLTLAADAYYKYTTDLLLNVDLPSHVDAGSLYRNEGEIENKGIEFAVGSKNFTGNFQWDTDFNISFNRNKVKKLSFRKVHYFGQTSDATKENVIRMTEGQPLGMFWGYICDGVDPETGDLIYRDTDGIEGISESDKTYIGNANPDFVFGLTNNFRYKGFTLNVFFQGSVGNDIFNASRIETEGMFNQNNQSAAVLDRWRIPGQNTTMPRATQGNENLRASTRFVEDGSYLRLKSLTFAYEMPKMGWMKKAGITRIQPYATANNLFTITKYTGFDPEVNQYGGSATTMGIDWGTYPQTRSFIFGMNVEF